MGAPVCAVQQLAALLFAVLKIHWANSVHHPFHRQISSARDARGASWTSHAALCRNLAAQVHQGWASCAMDGTINAAAAQHLRVRSIDNRISLQSMDG